MSHGPTLSCDWCQMLIDDRIVGQQCGEIKPRRKLPAGMATPEWCPLIKSVAPPVVDQKHPEGRK